MFTDMIVNGRGVGPVGEVVSGLHHYDAGLMRPYFGDDGRPRVVVNTGRQFRDANGQMRPLYQEMLVNDLMQSGIHSPVFNATALRKEEWIHLDTVVLRAARQRLRAWADLSAANTYGGFDGMSKMILEHETMSDPGSAVVDMDGMTEGRNDSPKFQLEGLPLPITHSDFYIPERKLAVSRNTGTPLDTTMAEAAGRRVAETIEQTLIGTITGVTYGGNSTQVGGYGRTSSVYGYTNYPDRITYTSMTVPTGSNPEVTVSEVLHLRSLLYSDKMYGPYMIYHSTDWDRWLDNDYARLGGNNANMTLRDRLRRIEGIQDVRRLDYLTSTYTMLIVQMTPDVCRAVNGMDITTVQWESLGGMRKNFKVMCIQVPQLRSDYNGNCGIVHATTA